jgi:hypothetical protein
MSMLNKTQGISFAVLQNLIQCSQKSVHFVKFLYWKIYSAFDRAHLNSVNQYFTHNPTKYIAQSIVPSVQLIPFRLTVVQRTGTRVTLQCCIFDCVLLGSFLDT